MFLSFSNPILDPRPPTAGKLQAGQFRLTGDPSKKLTKRGLKFLGTSKTPVGVFF